MHPEGVDYWTVEVMNGSSTSAARWQDAHGERLVEAALTHGAQNWHWVSREWGVIFEVAFAVDTVWLRFRDTPAVRAALDGVPDSVNGLLIYHGRGGSSAAGIGRRPRPSPMRGGAELPQPEHLPDPPERWLGPQESRTLQPA